MARKPQQHDPHDDANPRIDPQLDALLDAALSPHAIEGGVPADLASRIFEATKDHLPQAQADVPDVIARIGVRRFKLSAAIILLACEVAVVSLASSIAHEVRDTLVVKREFVSLASYQPVADPMDAEIELLNRQLDAALAGRTWDGGSSSADGNWDDLGLSTLDVGSEVVF